VHDGIEIEKRGVPAVVVCTEQFTKTGEAIAQMRGLPGYPFVVIPHPIANLEQKELAGRAEIAFPQVVMLLTLQTEQAD